MQLKNLRETPSRWKDVSDALFSFKFALSMQKTTGVKAALRV
jgi:hypothetical protein